MSESALEMVVEIPRGGRNKYEVDHKSGRVKLDRTLYTQMVYPADYGFIEHTLADDGDPIDALVLLEEPTFPGVLVDVRPVGVFRMEDENGKDAKILAVPASDPRWAWVDDIDDVPAPTKDAIAHFFTHYKDLEPGKFVNVHGFGTRAEAEALVQAAVHAYRLADSYES
ncbi:inorganic diphosphatase [Gryllotalpicola reticulitermitis]|uniref:Inorganic pyrophosphatase n=1 Tax=Gryllotalpicola reticulitermitis TaxID=1184153 RepID=A0ABV8Q6C1_9MICO